MTEVLQNDLQPEYMFQKAASDYLMTTERKIALFRKCGILRFGKLGKNYVYKKSWLDEFMDEWAGYDLSNEEHIRMAINARKWKTSHGIA